MRTLLSVLDDVHCKFVYDHELLQVQDGTVRNAFAALELP